MHSIFVGSGHPTGVQSVSAASIAPSQSLSRPSSQISALPLPVNVPVHVPFEQRSFVVHALPSLHAFVLLTRLQPPLPSHASVVQPLPSSQLYAVPLQLPFEQRSFFVHALPSLHAAVLLTCAQPPLPSHTSFVQPFLSLQL
jgi:hypothetical protein